ncbi:MAG: HNH endonuclease, partial [Rhodospirillaceae bacterium]|nr:HNH endonuclease [Rhodospirillaceae bacterium]
AAAALPFGGAGVARGVQSARRGKRAAGRDRGMPRDPDGGHADIDWSGHESTARYFDEVAGNARWLEKRTGNADIPTFGAGLRTGESVYLGKRIDYGDGRPGASVGEVRLYREGGKSYAVRPDGVRVDIGRLPRNAVRTDDGGWVATGRAADGTEVTIYYNPHGLPEFPARGAFWLPPEVVKRAPDSRTAYVKSRLRDMAHKDGDSLLEMGFTMGQIRKIRRGASLKDFGFEIHHDYRVGRMLIVDESVHSLAHRGGRSLW